MLAPSRFCLLTHFDEASLIFSTKKKNTLITHLWLRSLPAVIPTALRISAFVSPSEPNNKVARIPATLTGENKIFLVELTAL